MPTSRASGCRRIFPAASSASHSSPRPCWATPRRIFGRVWPPAGQSATSFRLPSSAISANIRCMEPMTDQKPEDARGLPRRRALRPKKTTKQGATTDEGALALARRIVDLAADKKAADIVLLEIGGLTALADYFVICSGSSERQLGAIADGIAETLRGEGIWPLGGGGSSRAPWRRVAFGSGGG